MVIKFLWMAALLLMSASCGTSRESEPPTPPTGNGGGTTPDTEEVKDMPESEVPHDVIVAYVTSWNSDMPDPSLITHINYAFGHVTDSQNGIRIDNPDRLKRLVALKKQNPELKVLLSIGGWGSGNFSEMAASTTKREWFAKDCLRVIRDYDIDGIDIDWEYPTSSAAGISSSPNDKANFTFLMRDIRNAIGSKYLLTFASSATAGYITLRNVMPYVDFVNIMSYDMGYGGGHNAGLYPSNIVGSLSTSGAVTAHLKAGVPAEKLVLGIPFYGRYANDEFVYYKDIKLRDGETAKWDEVGMVPYVVDRNGKFVLGYDDERSVAAKTDYAVANGLCGVMFWDSAGDDSRRTLTHTIYNHLHPNP